MAGKGTSTAKRHAESMFKILLSRTFEQRLAVTKLVDSIGWTERDFLLYKAYATTLYLFVDATRYM
jgi:hypothetical protein